MVTVAAPERRGRLLTPGEVSTELTISRSTIYRLVAAGEVDFVRIGGQLRFEPPAVAAFVERHRKRAGERPV